MNCSEVSTLISAFLAGDLTKEETLAVDEHLKECPQCQELSEQYGQLDLLVEKWSKSEMSPSLIESTLHSIQQRIYGNDLPKDEILTPEEVAAFLKIPTRTVYEMTNVLPFIHLGDHLRIRRESLLAWIEEEESRSRRRALAACVHERKF